MKRHEQDGTKVDFGVECLHSIVRDGYVLVPRGASCHFGCQAKSGEPFRVATIFGSINGHYIRCRNPVDRSFFSQVLLFDDYVETH